MKRLPTDAEVTTLRSSIRVQSSTPIDLLGIAMVASVLAYVWRIQDLYPILASVELPTIASLAALALFLLDQEPRRSLRSIRHRVTTCACILMMLAVVSVPTSVYPGLSFWFIVNDLSKNFLLFVILAASVRSMQDLKRYAAALVTGAAIYACYVYLYIPVGQSGRLGSLIYYDANDLGMLLTCSIPIALFFVVCAKRWIMRLLALGAIVLFLLVIIKSGSRGAFLALIAVGASVLLLFKGVSSAVRWTAVIVGALLLMTVAGTDYWTMMSTMLRPSEDYNWSGNSDAGRMAVWKRGLGYMAAKPLTGVGASAFPVAEGTISPLADRQQLGIGLKWSAAHNSFVQVGAELGVPGFIAFVALLWAAARSAASSKRERPAVVPGATVPVRPPPESEVLGQALTSALIGYVVGGFFLSQAYGAFTFALMAMIVGLSKSRGATATVPPRLPRTSGSARERRAATARRTWPRVS